MSIPITLVATLGTAARQGVLIKGGVYVEELARVKVVAMDKTGTLTRGEPEATVVVDLNEAPTAGGGMVTAGPGVPPGLWTEETSSSEKPGFFTIAGFRNKSPQCGNP